jgi:hypothetical protein
MKYALLALILLAGLALLPACSPWSPNNPPVNSPNPELQMLRDARQNGLRTRCAACHGTSVEFPEVAVSESDRRSE